MSRILVTYSGSFDCENLETAEEIENKLYEAVQIICGNQNFNIDFYEPEVDEDM